MRCSEAVPHQIDPCCICSACVWPAYACVSLWLQVLCRSAENGTFYQWMELLRQVTQQPVATDAQQCDR